MATPRLHPSHYPHDYARAFYQAKPLKCRDTEHARRHRQLLYAFREALRTHPDWNPELLRVANATKIRLNGDTLAFTRRERTPI